MVLDAARRRRSVLVDAVRTRLWPVPAAGVVGAVVAGVGLPELDPALKEHLPPSVVRYLFGGGADAARETLGAIATSLITVTSLTFSLTLVTLQLASSQYTPRLLRTFAADRFIQRTLALFLATFVYALTVLRTVRNSGDAGAEFVPQIAVTVAYLLAMASVLGLVLFLGHLVRQIRIETMLDHVSVETTATAKRVLDRRGESSGPEPIPSPPAHRSVIEASSSGFLVGIEEQALCAAAVDADAVVWIDQAIGSRLVAGVPAAFCWSRSSGTPLEERTLKKLCQRVTGALHTGIERTAAQDIGHGLQQLTDVVVRALSPGINDPTTAVYGVNSCTAVLSEIVCYQLGSRVVRDDDDEVRVVLVCPDLADLLDLVCTQPQHYGCQDPVFLGSMFSMLRELAWRTSEPQHHQAITDQLDRLQRTAAEQNFDLLERRRLDGLARDVTDALNREWTPTPATRFAG
jgi:uncharacterized membrane protein